MAHKAGFVNIVGNPNVGKSTLMNLLVGERISIATFKAQTTRHRIMGILNTEDMQICFSDTPRCLEAQLQVARVYVELLGISFARRRCAVVRDGYGGDPR